MGEGLGVACTAIECAIGSLVLAPKVSVASDYVSQPQMQIRMILQHMLLNCSFSMPARRLSALG